MYRHLEGRLAQHIRDFLQRTYAVELPRIVIEQPPRVELGEYALPLAFELAKRLRKAPRKIAEEIVSGIGPIEGFEKLELAGAGYINARVKRSELAAAVAAGEQPRREVPEGKVLVEHSSINPNKAAHIGHLRNAILGDTFVRLLKFTGREVDVQNYIDNTGVQVADVVVGLVHIKRRATLEEVKKHLAALSSTKKQYAGSDSAMDDLTSDFLDSDPSRHEAKSGELPPDPARVDYHLWDLYARMSSWYDAPGQKEQRKPLRDQVLHAIEHGDNELAKIAEFVSTAVLRRHLETMERLDIEYDFLPRESEILHLHFWDAAFEKLREAGVLFRETEGKNKDCWVMRRPKTGNEQVKGGTENTLEVKIKPEDLRFETYASRGPGITAVRVTHTPTEIVRISEDQCSLEKNREAAMNLLRSRVAEVQNQKVIVRSNGTVGYVGKDIAYHLWKFGLLGRDFGYRKFHYYGRLRGRFRRGGHWCWISTTEHREGHPHFGNVAEIYNVIDARQAEAQNTVIEALRELGHGRQADHYTHFSYEMVALTPRCAAELGYQLSEEDKARPFIEVSGRKGFGVKADDLIDALLASAKKEVDARHPELSDQERTTIAAQIAVGALRYFMLKFTKSSVIAFDFKEALSFEGETGPYAQYAVVRATNIFRKGEIDIEAFNRQLASYVSSDDYTRFLSADGADEIWELWLASAKTSFIIDQCIATTEPAYLAKHVFQLAQLFNTFYHRYPILSESDESRKKFLLATAAVVRRELVRSLAVMGIDVPSVM